MRPIMLQISILAILALASCTLPGTPTPPPPGERETSIAGTVSGMLTEAALAATPTLLVNTLPPTTTSIPAAATNTFIPASTPQNPLVVKDALCWEGPGSQYLVVSAVKNGQRVELLGRGSIGAWWIIDNPIYHDPCWVNADVLQFDTGYNLSGIRIFTPAPTPTSTPSNTPTPSKTPNP